MKPKSKILVLLFVLSLAFISCTKSGALTGSGTSNTSTFGTLKGSVSGGLSPIVGTTVSLFQVGSAAPLASSITNANGSFTMNYTNPGGNGMLYLLSVGGNPGNGSNSSIQLGALLGLASNTPSSAMINELTTAAFMDAAFNYGIVKDSNASVTFSAPNQAALNNAAAQVPNFVTNGAVNTALSSTNQTAFLTLANAIAACVEIPAKCSTLLTSSLSSTGAASQNILDSVYNLLNVPSDASGVYPLAAIMNGATGYGIPASIPSGLVLITPPVVAVNTVYSGLSTAINLGIDASGNIWVANFGNGTVTEISSSGALIGSFTVGTNPFGIAIDRNNNIWVSNRGSNNVTELNQAGSVIGTFSVGTGPQALAIDVNGNIWVPNGNGGSTVSELNSTGTTIGTFSTASPYSVAFDQNGNVWIPNNVTSGTLTELNSSGSPINTYSVGNHPRGVAFDPTGNIWVSNTSGGTLSELSSSGTSIATISITQANEIAIDPAGNIWVNGNGAPWLFRINSAATITGTYSIIGNSFTPNGLGIDAAGNLWNANLGGSLTELPGVAVGPEFFPYNGPVYPGGY